MSSPRYACSHCTEVYDSVDGFKCHIMKRHMRWFPYECTICNEYMAVSKMEIYMHLANVHEEQVVTYTSNGAMETELNRQIELGLVKGTQNMSNCSSGVATALTNNNTNSPASSRNSEDHSQNLREENIADAEIDDIDIDFSNLELFRNQALSKSANDSNEIVFEPLDTKVELETPSLPQEASSSSSVTTRPRTSSAYKIIDFIGLNSPKFNCDTIFNLCCLYGDVMTVQFLNKTKCVVEMREESGADNCIHFLNNLQVFDSSVTIMKSPLKHLLQNKRFVLEDGTDSFKSYEQSMFNRFSPSFAAKNKQCPPNRVLFLWNMPHDMTQTRLMQELKKLGVTTQISIRFYTDRNTDRQVGRAFMTFGSVKNATEALMLSNNKIKYGPNYVVKFSFKFERPTTWTQGSHLADPPMAQVQPRRRFESNSSTKSYDYKF